MKSGKVADYNFTALRTGEYSLYRGAAEGQDPVLLLVPREERNSVRRLEHEFGLREDLDSHWAARPLAIARHSGRFALVLEDPGGEPLDQLLGQSLDIATFLRIAIAIADTLQQVHERGLIHKDIKPANILVDKARGKAWLTGFSIASRLPREQQLPEPPEVIAGTLAYMAPEQTGRMNRSIDSRSDLYSLGVTFYELLTRVLPFAATDPIELIHCHIARQPVPPSMLAAVPDQLSTIVMKLLAKTAEERYQTVAGLKADLNRCRTAWEQTYNIDPFPAGLQDASNRLMIPEKLYGRASEIATLLTAFDKIATHGEPSLVLVSGYSGIGKSSVVNELHKVIVLPRGIFISGKFDQQLRDIPYATLAQAFHELMRQILNGGDVEIRVWRDAILEAVGGQGALLTDLIPELVVLIGSQPPVPALPPLDAQLRFQAVFQRFVGVFASADHPLVIFVDDLQWLDPATLVLIEYLITSPETQYLLLIGAYRDNEVGPGHPLLATVDAIRRTGTPIDELILAPLSVEHLEHLLCDALRCGQVQIRPLAELVFRKTGGNPFFAIQFLTNLAEEGLLKLDTGSRSWIWDIDGIEAKSFTDNLVDLMVRRLQRLPHDSQDALKQLACLGIQADFSTLAIVQGASEESMHESFRAAAYSGVIFSREGHYRFLHDRVQEAAYALIASKSHAEVHLQIARHLLEGMPQQKLPERVFDIVTQFNRAAPLLHDRAEKETAARLNLQAGRKAKTSLAYASACSYLSIGLSILKEEGWQESYDLTFAMCFELADCALLGSNFEEAEFHIQQMLVKGRRNVDRAEAYRLRVILQLMIGKTEGAVRTALECLRMFGLILPERPTPAEVKEEYEALLRDLGDRPIKSLIDLPLMRDEEMRVATSVMARLGIAAYVFDPDFYRMSVCRTVRLGLEHGTNEFVTLVLAGIALFIGPIFDRYEEGEHFGRVAVEAAERHGFEVEQAGTNLMLQMAVIWTRPIEMAMGYLDKASQIAQATGEVIYACLAHEHRLSNRIARGDPLDQIWQDSTLALDFVRRAKFRQCIDVVTSAQDFVLTLRGGTGGSASTSEAKIEAQAIESGIPIVVCFHWILQLQKYFLLGLPDRAIEFAERAKPVLKSARLHIQWVDYCFYHSLALAAQFSSAPPTEQYEWRQQLMMHLESLRRLAELCPETYSHKHALVAAEVARLNGKEMEAVLLYEKAVCESAMSGFVRDQALSNEMAFRFWLARGLTTVAQTYFREARDCYLRWGAMAKVAQLEQAYPRMVQTDRRPLLTTIETPVEHLDIAAVVRTSQAVASEIVLDRLIETLMTIAVEHAGADRGILVLPQQNELTIQAEAKSDAETIEVKLLEGRVSPAELPTLILDEVGRTREPVILDDARPQNPFSADRYIRRSQVRSLLCLPLVKQGELIGMLYLENKLASHAFTPARIAVLKLLSSQAAISLQNARLYSDLVNENREREKAEAALKASEASLSEAQRISRVGSWRWRLSTNEVHASAELLRIYGFDPATTEPSCDLFMGRAHPEDRPAFEQILNRAVLERQHFQHEYRIVLPDGSIKHAQAVGQYDTSVRTEAEFVGTVMDITERKRAEETVRNAEAEVTRVARLTTMGELVASIAHEINQPLASIAADGRACMNWLDRDKPELDEVRIAASSIEREARRASNVIKSLRALVTKSAPQFANLDIRDVIQEMLLLTRSELQRHNVALRIDHGERRAVAGDRVQLQQVLLNLIKNGIEAMSTTEQPKVLSITSAPREADEMLVCVGDTGIGLDQAVAARVFDPFFTTKPHGMGMGLSICRSIIESHGGRLWAQPNVPRGTLVQFTLPLREVAGERLDQPLVVTGRDAQTRAAPGLVTKTWESTL